MTVGETEGAGLRVRALTRRYGRVLALDNVDLCVPAGTVHGVIGPNGAGKTTLLAVLLGLVRADTGDVRLGERPLPQAGRVVPGGTAGSVEQPRFYGYLTARRNLEVLAGLDAPGGLDPGEALESVGLGDQSDALAARLSMGMRQRLSIAAALLRRPRLLVLDEPTAGLDPAGAGDLLMLVRSLAADGRSVLLSSHDLVMVAETCDHVTVLKGGRVVRSAPVDTLLLEAPPATYLLRTGDDRAARGVISALPDVGVEPADGGGLVVTAGPAGLDTVVAGLVSCGVSLRELRGQRAPLRALYDALVRQEAAG